MGANNTLTVMSRQRNSDCDRRKEERKDGDKQARVEVQVCEDGKTRR